MTHRILIVNDDGLTPGVLHMARLLQQQGHVVHTLLPDQDRSGSGSAALVGSDLTLTDVSESADGLSLWLTNGMPVDCTNLGMHKWPTTNLVISGPNRGFNALCYRSSGTIAAARQALVHNVCGIAFSANGGRADFDAIAVDAVVAVGLIEEQGHLNESFPTFCNVNLNKGKGGLHYGTPKMFSPVLAPTEDGTYAYVWPNLKACDNEVSAAGDAGYHSIVVER